MAAHNAGLFVFGLGILFGVYVGLVLGVWI